MQRIKMRLPATLTAFGPALDGLGLAVGLYTQVDVTPRDDDSVIVDPVGEGAGRYALGSRHPVVIAMQQTFAQLERPMMGVTIHINNAIPMDSGLNAEAAFMTAGVVAANNLLDTPFSRWELMAQVAKIAQPSAAGAASLLGGLVSVVANERDDDSTAPIVTSLPLTPFKVIVALPQLGDFQRPKLTTRVTSQDALANLRRLPLLLDGLRTGTLDQVASGFDDALLQDTRAEKLTGFEQVAEAARMAGALAVTTSGNGPAMVFIARTALEPIVEAIETAFSNLDITARVMVLPLDTQGITLSMTRIR